MRDSLATMPDAAALSEEEQNRLAQILDDYLVAVERGEPTSPSELLQRYPDQADYLKLYLSGLQMFHAAARGVTPHAPAIATPLSWAAGAKQMIGEFAIIRELGRGGMGVVYEAEQTTLRRRVALKVLPTSAAADAKQLGRFKNEAQAAAQVLHPHIVPVFAVGEADGVHYFAMQLIDGESLASLTHRASHGASPPGSQRTTVPNATQTWAHGDALAGVSQPAVQPSPMPIALDVRTIARFGQQAAAALHAAHEFGVIHRDVKPSNLLIDQGGKLWVADFGLARIREGADLTRTGDVCGTMRYMSPEQALGQAALVDHRSDVYSLAVTLYELAAGRHPFDETGDVRRLLERRDAPAKPLRHVQPRVPVDFDTIVMKAMAEFPGDRYTTAGEFADDLGRFLAREPIRATPPTRVTRLRKWAGRHRRAVLATAGIVLLAVVGATASLGYVAGANAERNDALQEARDTTRSMGRLIYDVPLRTAEQLAAIPGTEGVRRSLLEESLNYFVQLTRQSFGDPALGGDLALAYSKIGGLAAMMGDRERALDAHQSAREILEKLVASEPRNREYARSLALCRNNAGLVLAQLQRPDEAVDELSAALAIQERLHRAYPTWTAATLDLAATHVNLGLAAQERGDALDAIRQLSEAIQLQTPLLDESPDDETLLRALAAAYENLGAINEAETAAGAVESHQKAIELRRRLVAAQPLNPLYQAELARSYNNLGYASAGRGDWPAAQRAYDAAIALLTNLVRLSPAAATHRGDLAVALSNLGMALSEIGRLDEAEKAFQQSLDAQRELVEWRPADAAVVSGLGAMHNNLGMLHRRRSRLDDAVADFRRAIECQRQALELRPDDGPARELLGKHYINLGELLERQGKLTDALEIARQRQQLWRNDSARLEPASRDLAALERLVAAAGQNAEDVNPSRTDTPL
jgi:eukaryotic-like serine/threonine-protein kinase